MISEIELILDEIEELGPDDIISDKAAGFITWYLSELEASGGVKNDYETLMFDHWVDWCLSHCDDKMDH